MNDNTLLTRLSAYGADVAGAMERFMEDETLYRTCLDMLLADKSFAQLDTALKEQNWRGAFEAAHTLKGVTGNLGLTPLYEAVCTLVEPLRRQEVAEISAPYARFLEQLEGLRAIL